MTRFLSTVGWHGLTQAPEKTFILEAIVMGMRQAVTALAKTTAWLATQSFQAFSVNKDRDAELTVPIFPRQTVPPVCLKGVAS